MKLYNNCSTYSIPGSAILVFQTPLGEASDNYSHNRDENVRAPDSDDDVLEHLTLVDCVIELWATCFIWEVASWTNFAFVIEDNHMKPDEPGQPQKGIDADK